jgi:FdhD protein
MTAFLNLPVVRVGSDGATDQVVVEEPLEILIDGRNLAITMRTPGHDEELAVGFLFTEGLIKGIDEIVSIDGAGNRVSLKLTHPLQIAPRLVMTSACGVCGKASIDQLASACTELPPDNFVIEADVLHTLPNILKRAQSIFHQTGGLHAAGLFDAEGNLELLREDVGRHNAVDKLIGALLMSSPNLLPNSVLLVSGRASFELVQKAAMARIPILVAVGAPSSLAVETAQRFNMTLAGFLRDDRFNIYAGAERILTRAAVS